MCQMRIMRSRSVHRRLSSDCARCGVCAHVFGLIDRRAVLSRSISGWKPYPTIDLKTEIETAVPIEVSMRFLPTVELRVTAWADCLAARPSSKHPATLPVLLLLLLLLHRFFLPTRTTVRLTIPSHLLRALRHAVVVQTPLLLPPRYAVLLLLSNTAASAQPLPFPFLRLICPSYIPCWTDPPSSSPFLQLLSVPLFCCPSLCLFSLFSPPCFNSLAACVCCSRREYVFLLCLLIQQHLRTSAPCLDNLFCVHCQLSCNSEASFLRHCESRRHRHMQLQAKSPPAPPTDGQSTTTRDETRLPAQVESLDRLPRTTALISYQRSSLTLDWRLSMPSSSFVICPGFPCNTASVYGRRRTSRIMLLCSSLYPTWYSRQLDVRARLLPVVIYLNAIPP